MEALYLGLSQCSLFILVLAFVCYRFETEAIASESELETPPPPPSPLKSSQETSLVLHQVNLRLEDIERELLNLTKESLANLGRAEASGSTKCPQHCVYKEAEIGRKRSNQKLLVSP